MSETAARRAKTRKTRLTLFFKVSNGYVHLYKMIFIDLGKFSRAIIKLSLSVILGQAKGKYYWLNRIVTYWNGLVGAIVIQVIHLSAADWRGMSI